MNFKIETFLEQGPLIRSLEPGPREDRPDDEQGRLVAGHQEGRVLVEDD